MRLVNSYEEFPFFLKVISQVSNSDIEMLASISLFSDVLKKFLKFGKTIETENDYLKLRHCMLVNRLISDTGKCCRLQEIRESYLKDSSASSESEEESIPSEESKLGKIIDISSTISKHPI